jgi:hypothetical protein
MSVSHILFPTTGKTVKFYTKLHVCYPYAYSFQEGMLQRGYGSIFNILIFTLIF